MSHDASFQVSWGLSNNVVDPIKKTFNLLQETQSLFLALKWYAKLQAAAYYLNTTLCSSCAWRRCEYLALRRHVFLVVLSSVRQLPFSLCLSLSLSLPLSLSLSLSLTTVLLAQLVTLGVTKRLVVVRSPVRTIDISQLPKPRLELGPPGWEPLMLPSKLT